MGTQDNACEDGVGGLLNEVKVSSLLLLLAIVHTTVIVCYCARSIFGGFGGCGVRPPRCLPPPDRQYSVENS